MLRRFSLEYRKKRALYISGAQAYLAEAYRCNSHQSLPDPPPKEKLRRQDTNRKERKRLPAAALRGGSSYCLLTQDLYDKCAISYLLKTHAGAVEAGDKNVLKELRHHMDRSFVDCLLSYIERKELPNPEVYRRAHIDKRLFSKLISDREYKPSKDTALALAFALRLSVSETNDLLSRAGYILSHSDPRDVVLEYLIREGEYDLTEVNIVLSNLQLPIIGRQYR